MNRPDPHEVPRRGQAPARATVAWRPAGLASPSPFLADGRLDPGRLYLLLEQSPFALEGAEAEASAAGPAGFYGSATWRLSLGVEVAGRLAECLRRDPRARRAVLATAERELARQLGPALPETLAFELAVRVVGDGLCLEVALDAPRLAEVHGLR